MRVWWCHRFGPCRVGDGIHRHPGDRGIIGRRFASGMMTVADCGRRSITPVDSGMSLTALLMGAAEGPNSSPSSRSDPSDRPSSHSGFARCQSPISRKSLSSPISAVIASAASVTCAPGSSNRSLEWPKPVNVSGGNEVEVGGGVGAGRSVRDRPRTGGPESGQWSAPDRDWPQRPRPAGPVGGFGHRHGCRSDVEGRAPGDRGASPTGAGGFGAPDSMPAIGCAAIRTHTG